MWIIDFGVDIPLERAQQYQAPFAYVQEHVFEFRQQNNRKAYRDYWWIHAESVQECVKL
jgi:hypothetical protein